MLIVTLASFHCYLFYVTFVSCTDLAEYFTEINLTHTKPFHLDIILYDGLAVSLTYLSPYPHKEVMYTVTSSCNNSLSFFLSVILESHAVIYYKRRTLSQMWL